MNTTLTVCAHCKQRDQTVRLYRLARVGLRPLCQPCFESLASMGMDIQVNPALRRRIA